MPLTNALTIMIIILGVIAALVVAFSWVFARMWCKPQREPPSETPADYGLPFEPVEFFSHGVLLKGWFVPASSDAGPHPTVILTHGWSRNAARLLPLVRLLHRAKFSALLYDARGHGASGDDGPITIRKFAEDLVASIDYLETRSDVDHEQLGVLGVSMGGASAILAASTEPRIRTLVSCSAFADPGVLTRDYMKKLHIPAWPFPGLALRIIERWLGTTVNSVAPKNRIGQITAPLLLVHGDADNFVPPYNLDVLYAQAPPDHTERMLILGRGHSDVAGDFKCIRGIIAFLRRNLSPEHAHVLKVKQPIR